MGFLSECGAIEYGGIRILGKKGLENACTYPDFFRYWRDNLFERLMRLFIWDNTGSLEQKEIEERLYLAGHCGIADYDGELTAFFGSFFGPTKYYDEFTGYTVHCPVYSDTYKIGDDIVVINNNSIKNPSIEHVDHYAYLLAHCEVTMMKQFVEARDSGGVPIAQNEKAKQSLLNYQKSMYNGKINVVSDLAGIGVEYMGADRKTQINISEMWEVRKNLLKSFYADIGVRASFDKKSNAVIDEVTADTSMLLYNVSDMLEERKRGAEAVNEMFGTSWDVRLSDEIDYNTENQPEDLTEGGEEDVV
jgi:hypothetical protein